MKSLGDLVANSIRQECSAKKLGNVHPQASFSNMSHDTFLTAAQAIGKCVDDYFSSTANLVPAASDPILPAGSPEQEPPYRTGKLVLKCVEAMKDSVAVNTSLGTILLFAPILCCPEIQSGPVTDTGAFSIHSGWSKASESDRINQTLLRLSVVDSQKIYQAIAICAPGGLGSSPEMSVHDAAPKNLLDAMQYASEFDDVALQYVTQFELVRNLASRINLLFQRLRELENFSGGHAMRWEATLAEAVSIAQLELLAERPDSLIVRKGGRPLAEEVQLRAQHLYQALIRENHDLEWTVSHSAVELLPNPVGAGADNRVTVPSIADTPAWIELDHWMRNHITSEGKQMANPGTHADLIAAALLVKSLRDVGLQSER